MTNQIEAIISKAFGIPLIQLEHGMVNNDILEFWCFRWIRNARECNTPKKYEHIKIESQGYSDEFIEHKLASCTNIKDLDDADLNVNLMVSSHGDENREQLISNIFHVAHKQLMIRDFGAFFDSFDSE